MAELSFQFDIQQFRNLFIEKFPSIFINIYLNKSKFMNNTFKPKAQAMYKIVPVSNQNLCLTMSNSLINRGKLILTQYNNSSNQKFVLFENIYRNSIRIFNSIKDELVTLKVNNTSNGQLLKFSTMDRTESQNWVFEPCKKRADVEQSSCYRIKTPTDFYIDLCYQKVEKDTYAIVWQSTKSCTQIWKVIEVQ